MSINYDPDRVPEIPAALQEFADKHRLHIIHVICDEKDAKYGDQAGVSFFAAVAFLPRPGDRIELEDGNSCEVRRAHFRVVTTPERPDGNVIALIPNVYAQLI